MCFFSIVIDLRSEDSTVDELLLFIFQLIIPIERFLQPEETETHLLRLYFQALFSRTVVPNRCPLLYLIAIHHVNRFVYAVEKTHQKLRHDMMRELLASSDEVPLFCSIPLFVISK